jgi:threonine dehydratase
MHGLVDGVLLVDDDALVLAMRLVHAHAGLVAEASGVAGLAAILANPRAFEGMAVATVLTGSNLTYAQMQAGGSSTPRLRDPEPRARRCARSTRCARCPTRARRRSAPRWRTSLSW